MHVDVRISSGGVRGGAVAFALLAMLDSDQSSLPSWAQHVLYPTEESNICVAGVSIGAVLAVALACKNRREILKKFIAMFEKQPLAGRFRTHDMLHCEHLCELILGIGEPPDAFDIFAELSTDKDGIFYNSEISPQYTKIEIAYCKRNQSGEITQHVHDIAGRGRHAIRPTDIQYLRAAVAVPGLIAPENDKFDGAYVSSQLVEAIQSSLAPNPKPKFIIILCCTPLVSTLNFNFFENQKIDRQACTAYRGPSLPQSWQDTIANMQTMAILYDQAAIETSLGINLRHDYSEQMKYGVFWSKTPDTNVPVLFVAPQAYLFKKYASMSMLKRMDSEHLQYIKEAGKNMAKYAKSYGSKPPTGDS